MWPRDKRILGGEEVTGGERKGNSALEGWPSPRALQTEMSRCLVVLSSPSVHSVLITGLLMCYCTRMRCLGHRGLEWPLPPSSWEKYPAKGNEAIAIRKDIKGSAGQMYCFTMLCLMRLIVFFFFALMIKMSERVDLCHKMKSEG